jgi:hypothetical protein
MSCCSGTLVPGDPAPAGAHPSRAPVPAPDVDPDPAPVHQDQAVAPQSGGRAGCRLMTPSPSVTSNVEDHEEVEDDPGTPQPPAAVGDGGGAAQDPEEEGSGPTNQLY